MGRYVFPQEKNSDRDGTRLDQNDEISFMAGDAGDRIPAGWRPEGKARGVEIELIDPLDSGVAWVYLFDLPGAPSADLPDYVDYRVDGEAVFIESSQFTGSYIKGKVGIGMIRMRTPSGELGPNVLDRHRVGLEAEMAGDLKLPINVPESIARTRDIGVIDGPVRVIVDQVVQLYVGEMSFEWGSENFNKYYRCGQNNSVTLSLPVGGKDMFKTILMYWTLDFTPEVLGSYYLDSNQSGPLLIKNEVRKEAPDDKPLLWWGFYGPNGALLQGLDLDDDIVPYFTCEGRWRQNPDARIRRGNHPGRLEIGFGCHETVSMPGLKDYPWINYILVPSDPTAKGLDDLGKIFEHPLETKITSLP